MATGCTRSLAGESGAVAALRERPAATVLTPHDGEFTRLTGASPSDDRVADVRRLADATGAVVLLKGPTTLVAAPGGEVYFMVDGDARLATAGTGDVLAGTIGALLAMGMPPLEAAAAGAWIHARAAARLAPRARRRRRDCGHSACAEQPVCIMKLRRVALSRCNRRHSRRHVRAGDQRSDRRAESGCRARRPADAGSPDR